MSAARVRPLASAEEPDAELLARVAAGDLAPLGVLYDRHHADVRQFLVRATAGSGDADDLTHETFLTVARIADKYDGRASARPFLLGVAAQLVRRRRRALARLAQAISFFSSHTPHENERTPEDDATGAEGARQFERALANLSEEKRLAFLLVEREGLTGEETARALGIPVNTVWTRLHHARAELRRALSRGGAE